MATQINHYRQRGLKTDKNYVVVTFNKNGDKQVFSTDSQEKAQDHAQKSNHPQAHIFEVNKINQKVVARMLEKLKNSAAAIATVVRQLNYSKTPLPSKTASARQYRQNIAPAVKPTPKPKLDKTINETLKKTFDVEQTKRNVTQVQNRGWHATTQKMGIDEKGALVAAMNRQVTRSTAPTPKPIMPRKEKQPLTESTSHAKTSKLAKTKIEKLTQKLEKAQSNLKVAQSWIKTNSLKKRDDETIHTTPTPYRRFGR